MLQEARALRFAPAAARGVALRGAFCHGGHVCLVLQRLVPSLLDYVVESAALAPAPRLANLRALALQLLARARARLAAPARWLCWDHCLRQHLCACASTCVQASSG